MAFILRLVVEHDGSLVYGEVLSLESVAKGRFTTWDGLFDVLRMGLAPPD